jgi:ribonuclease-3
MGDSVLGFIITRYLITKFPEEQEGFLTKARTKMVRGKTLCEISKVLGLDKLILMDEKGERNGWNTNEHIMEDVFEALVGAIYLDLGMVHVKRFIFAAFDQMEVSLNDDNYKDQLMRWCQALKYPLPDYQVSGQMNGQFFISVYVDGLNCGSGFASTKKQAEQNAAQIVLKTDARFKNKDGPPKRDPCRPGP